MTAATQTAELRVLPIDAIAESPDNPRRHFAPEALAQLVDSIRTHGVLTPLLVRELPEAPHLLAAGHRRLRAAREAGLQAVPALLRVMTDAEFLEVLTIDNLQRDNLHPLEEAGGFAVLLQRLRYDIPRIAARVGRTETYVYDRLRLLKLIPPAQALFTDGKIALGHAVLLSRLAARDQARVIGTPKAHFEDGGLFTADHGRDLVLGGLALTDARKPVSMRELGAWIDRHIRFDPRAQDVGELFPETEAALQTAEAEALKVVAITFDYLPHQDAKDPKTRTYGSASWKRADGEKGSKVCPHAVMGVVVAGDGRGEAFRVCIEKQRCAVHWRAEKAAATRRAKERAAAEAGGQTDRWQAQEAKRRKQEEAAALERKRWWKAQPALLEALREVLVKAPAGPEGPAGKLVLERCVGFRRRGAKDLVVGPKAEDVVRMAAYLLAEDELLQEWSVYANAPSLLKRFGLDAKAIVDRVAPKAPAAKAKKPKPARAARATAPVPAEGPRALTAEQLGSMACEGCGCTEDEACEGGCTWSAKFAAAGRAVCSQCTKTVPPVPAASAGRGTGARARRRAKVAEPTP